MSLVAQTFVASLLDNPKGLSFLLEQGDPTVLFYTEADQALWAFVKTHLAEHGKLPARQTVASTFKIDLPQALEPPSYYAKLLREHYLKSSLVSLGQNLVAHAGEHTGDDLLDAAQRGVGDLAVARLSKNLHDFRHSAPKVLAAHNKAQSGLEPGYLTGWPTFDKQCAGIRKGDLVSLVGRPAVGKTWLALFMALNMWKQGKPTLFVSMELNHLLVFQRLTAMFGGVAAGQLIDGKLSTKTYNALRVQLGSLEEHPVPFWVLDANLAGTVEDLEAVVSLTGVENTTIDGAYMLQHKGERDIYKRVAANANLIKQRLCPRCPVTASWQFARTASKKKKGEKPDLEDIGYSDVIGQASSIVVGAMQDESAETVQSRLLQIIKGRNGETGSFRVKWDFKWTTDFSEIVDVDPYEAGELQL